MKIYSHYKYVFQMQFLRNAGFLIFMALMQILISIGIVIGFTYLMPSPDTHSILYLATGASDHYFNIYGVSHTSTTSRYIQNRWLHGIYANMASEPFRYS